MCSVSLTLNSMTTPHVIGPVTIINVSIYVSELARTKCFSFFPITFVNCSIWPNLLAKSFPETTNPLTSIRRSCLVSVSRPLFWLCSRVVFCIDLNCFSLFTHMEIFLFCNFSLHDHLKSLSCSIASPKSLKFHNMMSFILQFSHLRFHQGWHM